MSADNGIYILETDGPEFRVAHLQAIDDYQWDDFKENANGRLGGYTKEDSQVQIKNARKMWAHSQMYTSRQDAIAKADDLYQTVMEEGGVVEYGISHIKILAHW